MQRFTWALKSRRQGPITACWDSRISSAALADWWNFVASHNHKVIVYIRLSSLNTWLALSSSIGDHLSTLFRARCAGFPHSTRCRIFMTRTAGMRLGGYQGALTWNWLIKPLPSADIRNMVRNIWAGMLCRTRKPSTAKWICFRSTLGAFWFFI